MNLVEPAGRAAALAAAGDLLLGGADFGRVQALIRRLAGFHLAASRKPVVQSRLAAMVKAGVHAGFAAYLDAIERTREAGAERQQFVNALTTNLTSFFREGHHFPVLAAQLRAVVEAGRTPSVWCCAAATGEEPWSIAITAVETPGESCDVRIHATDIDTDVLAVARRGVYPREAVRDLEASRLQRFFLKGSGANAGKVRVQSRLSERVRYAAMNLVADPIPAEATFDAVFCRNVMIYFDRQVQQHVLARLHAALRPDGLLFVGHAENLGACRDLFVLQDRTVYRRAG